MKKTLTVTALLVAAVSGYSQGTVNFYGFGTGLKQQIFLDPPNTAAAQTSVSWNGYTVKEEVGSTSQTQETPKGTYVFAGTALAGTAYDAQMLASPVASDTLSDLQPVGTPLNFFTSAAAAGYITGSQTINFASGTTATVAIAAWANSGVDGAATSLAQAQADGYAWGISNTAQDPIASGSNPPTSMPTTIEGFSIQVASPEPSTIALGVLGASSLLLRRRK